MMSFGKLFILIAGTVLLVSNAFGETISGTVRGEASTEILIGANIFIEGARVGATSDQNGYFSITVQENLHGSKRLIASYIGYHEDQVVFQSPLQEDLVVNFKLKESLLSMDQIVVTGTRTERFLKDTPVTTQVVKGEQLSSVGANDISQVLSEVTGITIGQDNRFGSGIDLQGFGSNHILLMVDGVKAIGRLNGHLDLSQFDASQIERIEVVKGATSTLYGSQAMGGVINIITKKPGPQFGLSAKALAGSYGRYDENLSVNVPVGSWQPKLSIGLRRYKGFDLDESNAVEDGRGYFKKDAGLTILKKLGQNTQLQFQTNYFQEEQKRVLNDVFEEKADNERFAALIRAKTDSLFSMKVETGLEYSHYEHKYGEIVRSSGYYKESDPTTDELVKGDLLLSRNFDNATLIAGYSFEKESILSDRVENEQRNSMLNSVFIEGELPLLNALTLLVGARFDFHSIYGREHSPKMSLMVKPTRQSRIRLSYGHGFRAPSFKELYFDFYVPDVNLTIRGEPDLRPERSDAINLDYEAWNNRNYHVRLNFFYNRILDLITDVRQESAVGELLYTYANFDEAQTWGGEWDMKYFPIDGLELTLSYHYLDSWEKSTHAPLSGKIKHRANGGINYTFPYSVKLNLRAQYFGTRQDRLINDDTGEVTEQINVPDYLMFHTNLSVPLPHKIVFTTGVKNITNYINKTWGPMPGREWYLGLSYEF